MRVSVVIPVKNGARYLDEVLSAIEGADEIIVTDSGSEDDSADIARAHGARVLPIAEGHFGHGRTRNYAAGESTGDLIVFLTQDATPCPGWLDAYAAAFAADPDLGAAYGPHLPRPDTSPAVARELTAFFAAQDPESTFLSNVNAAYRRACWEEIRFEDVPYSEDQAFGRAVVAHSRWCKAYVPGARVLHAHDYGPVEFMRRYFDEYRGLRETMGHVEALNLGVVARQVRGDVAYAGLRAAPRSLIHHAGRRVFSALGSRHERLPAPVARAISLEGTGPEPDEAPAQQVAPRGSSSYAFLLDRARAGAAPLLAPVTGQAERETLHFALVIPPFRRGSGGHSTLFNLFTRLERRGHVVSVWVHDPWNRHSADWDARLRGDIREFFPGRLRGPVFKGFDRWYGCDVAVATGWETVAPVVTLDETRARAYVVQDHEPEFFPTSAEARWAEQTYAEDLYPIVCSPWLRDLMMGRYGAPEASVFDLAVDHVVYHPADVERRRDTVIFYARGVTPRRGVPLGLLALEELHRRRPDVRIVMFGDEDPPPTGFPYEWLGVATPRRLARAYSEATVGVCLSLTNYSLIPNEMLACGLPCVDLAGGSLEGVYGGDGPVDLVGFDPLELCAAIERLLDDEAHWTRNSRAGRRFAAARTWDHAAEQLETGLRAALRAREEHAEALRPRGVQRPAAEPPGPAAAALTRTVPVDVNEEHHVSERLFARLTPADVAAVEAALRDEERAVWDAAGPGERATLTVVFGAWHRIPAVLEKTGLRPEQPPEAIHAMARGPLAGGGNLYYPDMIEAALRRTGAALEEVRAGLDLGCSSGRVVRVLAAAYPQATWHGTDPNPGAITWAREHLGDLAHFHLSSSDPPLPGFADESLDLVVAISIWSHFAEPAADAWLREAHRVLRPGGRLFLTVHSEHALLHDARLGLRPPRQLGEISEALRREGYWFANEFGDEGDHGVRHPHWGTSYMTAEWLVRHACPQFSLSLWGVGQNLDHQDAVLLERR